MQRSNLDLGNYEITFSPDIFYVRSMMIFNYLIKKKQSHESDILKKRKNGTICTIINYKRKIKIINF